MYIYIYIYIYINGTIARLVSFNNGNKTKTISKTDQSRETAVCVHFHKSAFPISIHSRAKGKVACFHLYTSSHCFCSINTKLHCLSQQFNQKWLKKEKYSSLWSELLRSVLESILKDLHFEGLLCLRRERVKTSWNSLSFVFTAFCCASVAFGYRNTPW